MTVRIPGTIIRGQGSAAGNHAILIPLLAKHIPEIVECRHFGTINVHLDQALDKSRADMWTPRILWRPERFNKVEVSGRIEMFGFIKILFEYPIEAAPRPAWIMLPEGGSLTYLSNKAEVIAPSRIDGLRYGTACAIHIDHSPSSPAPESFRVLYGRSFDSKSSAEWLIVRLRGVRAIVPGRSFLAAPR